MGKLVDTAQMLEDLYYQDYRNDKGFFTRIHFMYLCGLSYSKLLEDDYKEARLLSKSDGSGYTDITLSGDWLTDVELEATRIADTYDFEAVFKVRPFSFPYDPYGFGVQYVENLNRSGCSRFIRGTAQLEWQICVTPTSDRVFFYTKTNKIIFKNVKCALEKVKVSYLQEITDMSVDPDGGIVPKAKEEAVLMRAFMIMKQARDGTVIDMTNNGNPNAVLSTELADKFNQIRNPG